MSLYVNSIGGLERIFEEMELPHLYGQTGRFNDRQLTSNDASTTLPRIPYQGVYNEPTEQAVTAYYAFNADTDQTGLGPGWPRLWDPNNVGIGIGGPCVDGGAVNGVVSSYIPLQWRVLPNQGVWFIVRGPCVMAADSDISDGDPITPTATNTIRTGVPGTDQIFGYALEDVTVATDPRVRVMIDVPFL